jgi:hypothetical protein
MAVFFDGFHHSFWGFLVDKFDTFAAYPFIETQVAFMLPGELSPIGWSGKHYL